MDREHYFVGRRGPSPEVYELVRGGVRRLHDDEMTGGRELDWGAVGPATERLAALLLAALGHRTAQACALERIEREVLARQPRSGFVLSAAELRSWCAPGGGGWLQTLRRGLPFWPIARRSRLQ